MEPWNHGTTDRYLELLQLSLQVLLFGYQRVGIAAHVGRQIHAILLLLAFFVTILILVAALTFLAFVVLLSIVIINIINIIIYSTGSTIQCTDSNCALHTYLTFSAFASTSCLLLVVVDVVVVSAYQSKSSHTIITIIFSIIVIIGSSRGCIRFTHKWHSASRVCLSHLVFLDFSVVHFSTTGISKYLNFECARHFHFCLLAALGRLINCWILSILWMMIITMGCRFRMGKQIQKQKVCQKARPQKSRRSSRD